MSTGFAGFDTARNVDRPREQKELFGQGGLARVRVRYDRKGASALDFNGVCGTHVVWMRECSRQLARLVKMLKARIISFEI